MHLADRSTRLIAMWRDAIRFRQHAGDRASNGWLIVALNLGHDAASSAFVLAERGSQSLKARRGYVSFVCLSPPPRWCKHSAVWTDGKFDDPMLGLFDSVRIINLADRADRRREIEAQFRRIGFADDAKVSFFEAQRPADKGDFPSVGARGCFSSHLGVLRDAIAQDVDSVLIVEDDFDFVANVASRGPEAMEALDSRPWDIFYGAGVLDAEGESRLDSGPSGLAELPPGVPVLTASFVAFRRPALALLEPYLTAMLGRPAGSPDYGPMHVDGAYSVFREHHPEMRTVLAMPPLGDQRPSRSDITPRGFVLDRFAFTQPLANLLRRSLRRIRS